MSKSKIPPADTTTPDAAPAAEVQEPTPFCTFLDLDGQWAILCNGATVIVGARHVLATLPVAGVFSAVTDAVNKAMA